VCCRKCSITQWGVADTTTCALRLRILMKDYRCPICKAELERVLITDNPTRTLEEYRRLSLVEVEHGFLCPILIL